MSFQQEFLSALRAGEDHQALLEIVRRHYAGKEPGREAYDNLEQLWLDLGFQNSDEESPLREELEFVMERVWYYGTDAGLTPSGDAQ